MSTFRMCVPVEFDASLLSTGELTELYHAVRSEMQARSDMRLTVAEQSMLKLHRDGIRGKDNSNLLITTIRAVRNRTGCLLRDAKDLCDAYLDGLSTSPNSPGSGSAGAG